MRLYTTFQTAMGWVGILASERGLLAVTLLHPTEAATRRELGSEVEWAECAGSALSGLVKRLEAYFSGEKVDFPDELDFSGATPFQKRIWQAARLIPYGETRSYLWIAEKIGKPGAARAVGQALGKNPLFIIVPCHRVVASDGGLGGFGGGLQMKRRLLSMESLDLISGSVGRK